MLIDDKGRLLMANWIRIPKTWMPVPGEENEIDNDQDNEEEKQIRKVKIGKLDKDSEDMDARTWEKTMRWTMSRTMRRKNQFGKKVKIGKLDKDSEDMDASTWGRK